ncbi:MAG: potassium channel family protein, partial [Candidatus Peregrinibacteria bacterium]|nr:potassium channel family protein [Candidatus Peregrinibacteria bacterium]
KKMRYRQSKYWFKHQWWAWFEYYFLGQTSLYGDSFVRWGGTAFCFAMVMAGIYFLLDITTMDHGSRIVAQGSHWYDYIYFSIITLTSLGFGDLIPHTFLAKLFVSGEVFFGFIMLGIFISLIQKKM